MKKYTALTNVLFLFSVTIIVGMENPIVTIDVEKKQNQTELKDVITYLGQRPITLAQSATCCHSIIEINDNNDEVSMRISSDIMSTWDLNSGNLKYTEKTQKKHMLGSIISDNKIAQRNYSDKFIVDVSDRYTGKLLFSFRENTHIMAIVMDDNTIITGLWDGKVNIRNINTGYLLRTLLANSSIKSLALHKNNKIIVGSSTLVQIWNMHNGELLKTFNGDHEHPLNEIKAIAVNDNMVTAKMNSNILKVWSMNTDALLITITGFSCDCSEQKLAIGNNYVVTASGQCNVSAQAWRLLPNLEGTPENNPLLWIMQKADSQQQDLIKRAYEATIAKKPFIIELPEEPSTVTDRSQEQIDGRLYPTLTVAVRNYLRTRLNITVY